MLNLLRGERITRLCTEPLHPGVGRTIKEDNEAFGKFGGRVAARRRSVPRPAKFREGTQEAGESDQPVAPEDPTL
ncbi:hypothetical protein EIP86_001835 [Pleurotus ostreatoroseus]|nr:hypothetical protein EIP86_001835 [Pleurotus ostreatoroseus]